MPQGQGNSVGSYNGRCESGGNEHQAGAIRILLVEDDAGVRKATHMLLKVEGFSVTSVSSLTEALAYVHAGHGIDLLISDFHLANGETGLQVLSELRESLGMVLKALITTGDTSTAIKQLPRDPALLIASKPVQAEELLAMLHSLLAK